MWALTQPHNDFPFLCCYFCATGLCQDATRLGWPQRSNSGLVVVLGPSPGSQAGSPFRIQPFFPPFHPSFHSGNKTAPLWGGETFSPISFALGLWRPGHIVLQTNSIIFTMKKQANKHTNLYIHALYMIHPTLTASFVLYICWAHLHLRWSLAHTLNRCPKIGKVHL